MDFHTCNFSLIFRDQLSTYLPFFSPSEWCSCGPASRVTDRQPRCGGRGSSTACWPPASPSPSSMWPPLSGGCLAGEVLHHCHWHHNMSVQAVRKPFASRLQLVCKPFASGLPKNTFLQPPDENKMVTECHCRSASQTITLTVYKKHRLVTM